MLTTGYYWIVPIYSSALLYLVYTNGAMKPRIFGAIIVGVFMVVGSYAYTNFWVPEETEEAQLLVVEPSTPLRGYLATKDKNGDGVPDWQEALRTTEPLELNQLSTSTYEVPDTLTDQFAIQLFEDMIQSKSFGEFGATPEEIIARAGSDLTQQAEDTLFTRDDILIRDDNSPEALRTYANTVAAVTLANGIPADTKNEALIVERALQLDDPTVLEELTVIIDSYAGMRTSMLETPVPSTLVKEHLDLINAYHAIHVDVTAMSMTFSDPLYALLRVQRYQEDATGLYYAFTNVFKEAYDAGARFEPNDITLEVVTITDE